MRVLVVEDDAISRALCVRALEASGHACASAADGEEAWQRLQHDSFEVVLSDWMMPRCDGPELCQRVRGLQPYTYFVLLTSREGTTSLVEGMAAGADDFITKPLDREVLNARLIAAERIVTLHRQLDRQNAELSALNQRLYEQGRIDGLTGIGNRLRLNEDLLAIHDRVVRYGHRYSVALCDVDFFKKYNDSCGHQAGDEALRAVAQTLDEQSRLGDQVYRYGGEEFAVVLPEQGLDQAAVALDRMRRAVAGLRIPHPGLTPSGFVTISSGLACFGPDLPLSIEEVLRRADEALYQAKRQGRNRVVCHGCAVVAADAV